MLFHIAKRLSKRGVPFGNGLIVIVAIALISAFALHAIQIEHTHIGGTHQETITTIFHAADKKLFIVLFVIFSFFVLLRRSDLQFTVQHFIFTIHSWVCVSRGNTLDTMRQALRRGIIHPKLCG